MHIFKKVFSLKVVAASLIFSPPSSPWIAPGLIMDNRQQSNLRGAIGDVIKYLKGCYRIRKLFLLASKYRIEELKGGRFQWWGGGGSQSQKQWYRLLEYQGSRINLFALTSEWDDSKLLQFLNSNTFLEKILKVYLKTKGCILAGKCYFVETQGVPNFWQAIVQSSNRQWFKKFNGICFQWRV